MGVGQLKNLFDALVSTWSSPKFGLDPSVANVNGKFITKLEINKKEMRS